MGNKTIKVERLWKRYVLSLDSKSECWMDAESRDDEKDELTKLEPLGL